MNEPTTLGPYLRRERERRGLTLRAISESTKVSIGLLEGLEADNISRWPGGIFRRAFVRSYAEFVGLDPDDVLRRFEEQFKTPESEPILPESLGNGTKRGSAAAAPVPAGLALAGTATPSQRARLIGTAADLAVAVILAFGSAAAGSRLLWPVLLIAAYYAVGVLLTGTSPMVALLGEQVAPAHPPVEAPAAESATANAAQPRAERRHQPRRAGERSVRHRRGMQARA